MTTADVEFTWRVVTMTGRAARNTITHPLMAVAPGCKAEPHPTRSCGCRPFRSRRQAELYVAERSAS